MCHYGTCIEMCIRDSHNSVAPYSYASTTSRVLPAFEDNGELAYYQTREGYKFNVLNLSLIHIYTDKSVYTVGDKLWFRAYQVHAAATFPMVFSHYIYVDLIDRRDSVIQRVKIVERDSCFFGQIEIPKDLQQGEDVYKRQIYTERF